MMLSEAADLWGVEQGYHDIFGKWHQADPRTLSALIDALSAGCPTGPQVSTAQPDDLRAFQGDGSRRWGLSVQLYSLRSARNWGIGDFSDLRAVIKVAAATGADAVGLNPLHALFLDRPENASPYAPNSRLLLNPLYIDVTAVPEFPGLLDREMAQAIERLRGSDLVNYPGVAAVKERAFRQAYDRFLEGAASDRRLAFERFRTDQGEKLTRFSSFEVLRRRFGGESWRQWPEPWRKPDLGSLTTLRAHEDRECGYFEFLQWIASEQLAGCMADAREAGLNIGLYLDLAVGVDPEGADAWSNQAAVLSSFSVGAPPDEYNPRGQDWGLAPFNPHVLAENDFALFRELLTAAMRYAGAVRLDHVLGLKRLFLVPHHSHPSEGAYVRFPFEPLLRVIAEESHRHGCVFIGEDLGTVPEGFRETAERWGIWSYRVMMFERSGQGEFKSPHEFPEKALATFNTHDLPTFRGWMSGADLATKRAIGVDPGESDDDRQNARAAMIHALSKSADGPSADSFAAPAYYLAKTPARLVMVAAEDMLDAIEQVNIPGTIDQHPNWRRKLPVDIDRWQDGETWKSVTAAFDRAGRTRG